MSHDGQMGVYFTSGPYKLLGTLFLAQGDNPKPTALILHGIPGIEKNYDIAHALRNSGWNSVIFHYRGSWGSEGDYALRTIPDDVKAAIDAIESWTIPQIDPAKLVLIGHSLGAWAAVLASADDQRVKAVAVYSSVAEPRQLDLDAAIAEAEFTPWLHGISPTEFEAQWRTLDDRFNPVEQVGRLTPRPLLVLHGETDTLTSVEHAESLFQKAGEPRRLAIHPEANHVFSWHRPWLREQILGWLSELTWS